MTTQRRQFLGQLVGGAASLVATACATAVPAQSAAPAPAPKPADPKWDLSWTDSLSHGTHSQVFDAPEIADGTALHMARMFYVNYKEVYSTPETDLRAVLVFRHEAIPVVLGDAVWAHYPFIGKKMAKLKDPTTNEWTQRNPFLNAKPDDKYALIWPDGGLDNLMTRGAIVLGCNLALHGFAGQVAKRTNQSKDVVFAEFESGLVPGVKLVPSGIFGVIRAEQGGCAYIRAT